MVRKHYERTNYPDIYRKTYWGMGERENMDGAIIDNRNRFIRDNNIYKCLKGIYLPKYLQRMTGKKNGEYCNNMYDHVEYYKTRDNVYMIISSPYNRDVSLDDCYEKVGWKKIYNLYTMDSTTYVKFVPIVQKKRKRLL